MLDRYTYCIYIYVCVCGVCVCVLFYFVTGTPQFYDTVCELLIMVRTVVYV